MTLTERTLGEAVLTEFLARNESTVRDEDGEFADWIEISNPGDVAVDLQGWALTDAEDRLEKWRFPDGARLQAGERRLVFATGWDRRDIDDEWHTNFRLSAPGEFVALVRPDGEVATAYQPAPQFDDVSFGMDESGRVGYLVSPTPGEANAALALPGPVISGVTHAPAESILPRQDVTVTARVEARVGEVGEVKLHHRVDHNSESSVVMVDDGSGGDAEAGDGVYTGVVSGSTLFGPRIPAGSVARWYVTAEDDAGNPSRFPPFLDRDGIDQSAGYLGAQVEPEIDTDLPVLHWYRRRGWQPCAPGCSGLGGLRWTILRQRFCQTTRRSDEQRLAEIHLQQGLPDLCERRDAGGERIEPQRARLRPHFSPAISGL